MSAQEMPSPSERHSECSGSGVQSQEKQRVSTSSSRPEGRHTHTSCEQQARDKGKRHRRFAHQHLSFLLLIVSSPLEKSLLPNSGFLGSGWTSVLLPDCCDWFREERVKIIVQLKLNQGVFLAQMERGAPF